jgi:hypothetical protein
MRVSKLRDRDAAIRGPQRPPRQDSSLSDPTLDQVRDYLLATRDFDNFSAVKLISLHDHMPSYIHACLTDGDSTRARECAQLRQDLQIEFQREAALLNPGRSNVRRPKFTQPYFPLFDS